MLVGLARQLCSAPGRPHRQTTPRSLATVTAFITTLLLERFRLCSYPLGMRSGEPGLLFHPTFVDPRATSYRVRFTSRRAYRPETPFGFKPICQHNVADSMCTTPPLRVALKSFTPHRELVEPPRASSAQLRKCDNTLSSNAQQEKKRQLRKKKEWLRLEHVRISGARH